MNREYRFAMPLTGGMHHALHLLPIAAALDERGHQVRVLTMDHETDAFARRMLDAYAPTRVIRERLSVRTVERGLARVTNRLGPMKSIRLLEHRASLADADALIVAERTTSLLGRLRLLDVPTIHVPHGAGDRAVGYEPRIARYDLHLVAGPKDRTRFIEAGLAAEARVVACGYIKFAGVAHVRLIPPRLFADDKPVILYNPHFDAALGSFGKVGPALLNAFGARTDLNFIVAPHINLAKRLSSAERAAIIGAARANVLVDLGSERSCDMSYTRAADMYLGDVSSQVYEFAHRSRPVVFIDANGTDWRADPHFAMWAMGAVVPAEVPAILAALDAAAHRQASFADAQAALVADALGPDWAGAPDRAADAILAFMADRKAIVASKPRPRTP